MALALLSLLLAGPLVAFALGVAISAPRYRGAVSDHFDGRRFHNPGNVAAKGGFAVFTWMITRKRGPWRRNQHIESSQRPPSNYSDGIRVTFVNHSTFLIQLEGMNILTDPVWGRRASPFSWAGPQRMTPPGLGLEELPRIDLVVLTHNHYDHLDIDTMRTIFGAHHPRIVVPLGVRAFLEQQSLRGAEEVDWWDLVTVNKDIQIQAVPAQHFSGRGFLDRDATLWCGYVLKTPKGNIYFAGDTGYNPVTFKEIGTRCGPMKISFIPIGAYRPQWFMAPIHVSPEDAMRIHSDVRSETSIAMHYGTFALSDEGQDEPLNDLKAAMGRSDLDKERFLAFGIGEARAFEWRDY
jgi:L-ascorbate metabolism protein UlaG (beta-lactamase superfamily)